MKKTFITSGKRQIRITAFLFVIFVLQKPLRGISRIFSQKFNYIFVGYPGSDKDLRGYAPAWWIKNPANRRIVSLVGIVKKPKNSVVGRGLVVVVPSTIRQMLSSQEDCLIMKDNLQKLAKILGIKAIAIAGRAPTIFMRHNISMTGLFVKGTKGMVFCTIQTLEAIIKRHSLAISSIKVCIFGAGRVGIAIKDYLKANSYNVSIVKTNGIFDKDSAEDSNPVSLEEADIIIVISAKGSDIYPFINQLKKGAIIIDDTHPRMLRTFDNIFIYRASIGLDGMEFIPPLPNYSSTAIPGCMLEAVVKSVYGETSTQEDFNQKAIEIGFKSNGIWFIPFF